MDDESTPFASYATVVRAEWLDYNGHMHDASYAVVLSDANEMLFAALGLSADYRETTGCAFYTVECHIRFLAECSLGQRLSAVTIMVAADPKKMRLYTELLHEDGRPAASGECLYLHVDASLGATVPLSTEHYDAVHEMLIAHARLPRPAHLGLGVGAARGGSPLT